jgi:hypothetical protein
MLFEPRLRRGLRDGTITLAFRRWQRPQVTAGRRYRLGGDAGLILVTAIDAVAESEISAAEARAAGYASPDALRADLRGPRTPTTYRVRFGDVSLDDPRASLSQQIADAEDLAALAARVARIPGADATLLAISERPGVRAADLFAPLGWTDLQSFKLHVRKLKALGLTHSLTVGYELSPRGRAYLIRQR